MSEWNRNDRNEGMRRSESDDRDRNRPNRSWNDRDRDFRERGGREQRSFGGDHMQGPAGQGYGYGERQDQGASGYARSGQGYGGQAYGQGYGGPGHPGQSYGSGESYGQSGQSFGRQSYGARSYGGQDYRGGGYAGGRERGWSEGERHEGDWRGQRYGHGEPPSYGRPQYDQGGAGRFDDPNEEVRRVTDGDTGGSGMMRMFGGGMSGGQHRGKGPKNYTRSDDRIREDVNDRLADDAWLDASEIDVQVSNCEVTLTGTVDSREDKRRAEDLAERVSGVKHVQNNLRVQPQGSTAAGGSTQGTSNVGERSSLASGATSTGGTIGKTN